MPSVLFLSPGYPGEMPHFVRGLAEVGAEVFGLGDQPAALLPEACAGRLSGYLRVRSLWDEAAVVGGGPGAGSAPAPSTASSASGSPACSSPPACARRSAFPA